MKELDKAELVQSYLISMSAIRLASSHLISIQNKIGQFEYSKPVNIAHKDLDDVWQKLDKNLEAWTSKTKFHHDRKYTIKVELISQQERQVDKKGKKLLEWLAIWIEDGMNLEEYSTDEDKRIYGEIRQRLSQPRERKMDDEWIKEKARELRDETYYYRGEGHINYNMTLKRAENFIRSIVQEIQRPKVKKDKLEMFVIKIIPSIAEGYEKAKGKDIFISGLVSAITGEISKFLKDEGCEVEQ